MVLTFEDGTKGLVLSNDITLGGIVNTLNIYANNNVIKVDMAANDAIKAYAPTTEVFGDEYITEKSRRRPAGASHRRTRTGCGAIPRRFRTLWKRYTTIAILYPMKFWGMKLCG